MAEVASKYQLEFQGEVIPSIEEDPIQCLGEWYDSSLNDRSSVPTTEKQVEVWLRKIESSGLPGKFSWKAGIATPAAKAPVAADNL